MKILAIDTATEACSAALAVDGRVLARFENVGRSHTARLMPMVLELMAEAGLITRFRELETAFADWRKEHPQAKLLVFGHAERDEEDPRKLSARRAQALLVHQAARRHRQLLVEQQAERRLRPLHVLEQRSRRLNEPMAGTIERLHASVEYKAMNWHLRYLHNGADFYDLFGPVERSRSGDAFIVSYNKTRIYDPPRQLDLFGSAAAYFGLERLPTAQNIVSPSRIFALEAGVGRGVARHLRRRFLSCDGETPPLFL